MVGACVSVVPPFGCVQHRDPETTTTASLGACHLNCSAGKGKRQFTNPRPPLKRWPGLARFRKSDITPLATPVTIREQRNKKTSCRRRCCCRQNVHSLAGLFRSRFPIPVSLHLPQKSLPLQSVHQCGAQTVRPVCGSSTRSPVMLSRPPQVSLCAKLFFWYIQIMEPDD